MRRTVGLLGAAVLLMAMAMPAFAQAPDPYGEVLPGGATQPDDEVASPDDGAAEPGAADRAGADRAGADRAGTDDRAGVDDRATRSAPRTVSATQSNVTVLGRQLPATGGELTITLLVLGAVLVAGGTMAVALARRRTSAAPQ